MLTPFLVHLSFRALQPVSWLAETRTSRATKCSGFVAGLLLWAVALRVPPVSQCGGADVLWQLLPGAMRGRSNRLTWGSLRFDLSREATVPPGGQSGRSWGLGGPDSRGRQQMSASISQWWAVGGAATLQWEWCGCVVPILFPLQPWAKFIILWLWDMWRAGGTSSSTGIRLDSDCWFGNGCHQRICFVLL